MEWNQHFCLKWNNYSSKICSAFNDLWLEGEQIDLCIITGERKLHAHRIILSACSLFFRDALKDVPMNQIAVLVLPTINTDDLEDLLQFIYTGEVNVEESRLKSLVDTANLLKIEGICGRSDKIDSSFKEPHALEKLLAATTRKDPLESTPKETKESASENLSGTSGSNLNTQAKLEQSPATNADILMKAEIEDDDDNSSFFDSEAKVNFQDSSNMSSWSNNSANNGEPECKHDSDMKMDDAMKMASRVTYSRRKELSIDEKVDLINSSEGKSQRQLAKMFGVGKTQVQRILKRKEEILDAYNWTLSKRRHLWKNYSQDPDNCILITSSVSPSLPVGMAIDPLVSEDHLE